MACPRPGGGSRGVTVPPTFAERVAAVLADLSVGDVVSYGEVAAAVGARGAARGVGGVLRTLDDVPWWRVVRADGSLAAPKHAEQRRRLEAEGVTVRSGRASTGPPRVLTRPGIRPAEDRGDGVTPGGAPRHARAGAHRRSGRSAS
ncbi:MAG: MGMT family protein [Egibacteraceae bacterium]